MDTFSQHPIELPESPMGIMVPQSKHIYFLLTCEDYQRVQARIDEEQDVLGMYPLLAEIET